MEVSKLMIQDALRYMQVPESDQDDTLVQRIRNTYHKLSQMNSSKYVYKIFSINSDTDSVFFDNTGIKITSSDLVKLFADCSKCYILAVTLGQSVDRQISITQKTDMLDALVLDACASVLADKICDDIEEEIVKGLKADEFLTMRFSPGYGDVSLEVQQEIIDVLDATKRIGLSLTKTNMLVPTKSVTAFIGVANRSQNKKRTCSTCNLAQSCVYKRTHCISEKRGD